MPKNYLATPSWYRRVKVFFQLHWIKILVITALVALVVLSIWGLMSLESFYRHLTLAQMPLQILLVTLNAAIFVMMYMMLLRGGFAKLDKARIKGEEVAVHWDDVIGIDEVKEEAWEVVQLIRDHKRLTQIGGKIIRGILMIGPPGCGKTYLAKAIATEAGVPFISMSGAEFVEIFVGVGASRVRKLFKKARQLAYAHGACIVFIDELDAVARKRVFSVFGGTEETNSTQNQLLAEMDGLTAKDYQVIVIGATNAAEGNLDEALLRPGRFDRKLYIDKPGLEGRQKILEHYLKKVKYDASVNIPLLARKTVFKSPADLQNLVRESALIATRQGRDIVIMDDLSEAAERIDLGLKRKRRMTEREREIIAYHETGHLVTMYILHPTDDVFKASIVARKDTLGVVYGQPREEWFTHSRERILANIKVAIAGYVSEKVKFGVTSDGCSSDFRAAMSYAHAMVWRYGMGLNGFLGDYTAIPEHQISEELKQKLNAETQTIMRQCADEVEGLLRKESVVVERFAKELLQREELEYDEIERIFAEYGKQHTPLPSSS